MYFDYNATTPICPEAAEEISRSLFDAWGNPSSGYSTGKVAKAALDRHRTHVATDLKAAAEEITFMSGGTEANHWIIHSTLELYKKYQKDYGLDPMKKPHIITSSIEHVATELPLKKLEQEGKADVTYVSVDHKTAGVNPEELLNQVRADTCLVTIMMANNETGAVQPVAEIGRGLRAINEKRCDGEFKTLFHSDAAQAIGKVPVDVEDLKVDFLSIVGHKFYGPRVGALYHRHGAPLLPLFLGGGQESGLRSGTENVAMAAGLSSALTVAVGRLQDDVTHFQRLRMRLADGLKRNLPEGVFRDNFSHVESGLLLPNTLSASFLGVAGSDLLRACHPEVEASTQAACHTGEGKQKGSRILIASGISEAAAASTVRLSVGRNTTYEEVDRAVDSLAMAYSRIKD